MADFTITVYKADFTPRKVTLPGGVCPGCGRDLTQPGAVIVSEYQDQSRRAHLSADAEDYQPEMDSPEGGETFWTLGILCDSCDTVVADGEERVKEMPDPMTSTPEKLLAGAQKHGEESEPEHEAGDLADILRYVWPRLSKIDQEATYDRFAELLGAKRTA